MEFGVKILVILVRSWKVVQILKHFDSVLSDDGGLDVKYFSGY